MLTWPATHDQVVEASKLVPDDIVQMICAAGTPEEVRAKVGEYITNGCTCPILYPLGPDVALHGRHVRRLVNPDDGSRALAPERASDEHRHHSPGSTRNPLRSAIEIAPIDPKVTAFHARMPAYSPTMLVRRAQAGFPTRVSERLLVKAETRRMGLPSFKILGASWATYKAICEFLGYAPEPWRNINELAANLAHLKPFKLATATDGNHGRAVAYMARLLGFDCHVFVPRGMVEPRIQAIRSEGALVTVVDGTYDEAVARSAQEASTTCLVISDTSWEGYEDTPMRVIDGYSTIFHEVDDAIGASGLDRPRHGGRADGSRCVHGRGRRPLSPRRR